MSRIVDVSCTRVRARLHTPFVTALRRTETVDTVLVRVRDTDGVVGYGEAPQVWQVTGESLASATACVEQMLAPLVVGTDTDDWSATTARLPRAVARNAGAKAAVDVALHDLAARRSGVRLAELLRTTYGDPAAHPPRTVTTDVTLSAGDADALAAAAVARVADGFGTLKLKVGTDAATDVARVRAVREAVGPDPVLRLDANQGWTPEDAVDVVRALEAADLGVELVEQPVPGEDVEGLAWVRARVGLPVMADEALFTAYDLERILRLGAADAINVKLAKTGSLAAAAALLRRAAEHGLGTMVGSMMETHVGLGAAASLVAAVPTSGTNDLDAAWWAAASPYDGGITYDGPVITLPDVPGLGIERLHEDAVA
ncbi:mandelate racemase/muconate lactonizing enzyme family protein [Lapillicoccus jejuensis]|uniref:Dipeptide epimerase n=1 Tax=Lapillicoccus jejuensis TaxID=402171 RepID=A0A542E6D5_9MICO|nr:dipeptide epimerase [Lapillicoccus jejuensis]TQJ10887.1 o-succinylbenzoate synthase [Lapillicoccus jejuensis]